MADNEEEAAVASQAQTASVGYFDETVPTEQVNSRARAAQEDLAKRTEALADRAPDLLARLGNLKGDAPAQAPPKISTPPKAPAPAKPVAKQPVPAKPAQPKPAPPKPVAKQPVPAKPAQPKPAPPKPAAKQPVPAKPAPPKPVAKQPEVVTGTSAGETGDPSDALDRLRALAKMLEEQLISSEEFDTKKAEVLSRI